MSAAEVTRRVQRLLFVVLVFLLGWQVAALAGAPRHVQVVLGLYGFVFHFVFAKAYSLVPSYFARGLALPRAPAIQLPLSALGVVGMVSTGLGAPAVVGTLGTALWLAGVVVFVAPLAVLGLLAGGLLVDVVGLAGGLDGVVLVGRIAVLAGAVGYAYLIAGLLRQNRR